MSERAVFLDRDGTIIEDQQYAFDPLRIRFTPFTPEGLRRLSEAGYRLVVVTNQSGVARGYFGEEAVRAMHDHLRQTLRAQGVQIDAFYYCPHHPEGAVAEYAVECECRKPRPGLILKAGRDLGLDLERSWLVGDILDDVAAGQGAGCQTVLLTTDEAAFRDDGAIDERQPPRIRPTAKASDLLEAARLILGQEARLADGKHG